MELFPTKPAEFSDITCRVRAVCSTVLIYFWSSLSCARGMHVTSRGPPSHNGGRGGDWDKWRQKVWDGSILETSVDSSPCQLEAAVEAVENRPASMNNGSNRSIDPSCTDQPPLAIDIILSEYIFELFFFFSAKLNPQKRSLWENHCSCRNSDLMDRNRLLVTVAPLQRHFWFKVIQVQQRINRFKIRL